jgi:very-short-patch-repair endonuclease
MSPRQIQHRLAAGRLHPRHRGVYSVGHRALTLRARWMAAVLACGPGALLSHRDAAALWNLRRAPAGPIDVTAPGRHQLAGIRSHTARALHPADSTVIDGIPVTSLARTLLDNAEIEHPQRLRTLVEAAIREQLLDMAEVYDLYTRGAGRRGLPKLKAVMSEVAAEPPWTQSGLERALLELIRGSGLPEPSTNVSVDGFVVDAHWPEHNLIVEVDGWTFHRTRRTFENDHRKLAVLAANGRRVAPFTAQQVFTDPGYVVVTLARLMGASAALPGAAGAAPPGARSGRSGL